MSRGILADAKKAKNDEFYTQYDDIQSEINAYIEYDPDVFRDKTVLLPCDDPEYSNFTKFFAQNFENFGLKKLISTSYAYESKALESVYQLSFFEEQSPQFDPKKTKVKGKIFTLTRDGNQSSGIDIADLEWRYLEGDGDFRSAEVAQLREEADFIITNPPFSLFREFLAWVLEADKKFIIIGNKNSITYKEVFPLIKENKIWIGRRNVNEDIWFEVPQGAPYEKIVDGIKVKHIMGCWFTNVEHGKRHEPLRLMTMADNLRFSKHEKIKEQGYLKYDNYDAIDVPYVDAIPGDYMGAMGVPITFVGQYCPEQFEIIGLGNSRENFTPNKDYIKPKMHRKDGSIADGGAINRVLAIAQTNPPHGVVYYVAENSQYLISPYARVLIRRKNENDTKD